MGWTGCYAGKTLEIKPAHLLPLVQVLSFDSCSKSQKAGVLQDMQLWCAQDMRLLLTAQKPELADAWADARWVFTLVKTCEVKPPASLLPAHRRARLPEESQELWWLLHTALHAGSALTGTAWSLLHASHSAFPAPLLGHNMCLRNTIWSPSPQIHMALTHTARGTVLCSLSTNTCAFPGPEINYSHSH